LSRDDFTCFYLFFKLFFRRWGMSPPSLSSSCMKGGMGVAKNFFRWVKSKISPVLRSTRTRLPSLIASEASGDSRRGRPRLKLLRKKIRAKLLAMIQEMPAVFRARGACSREEPQPKFFSANRISPFFTSFINSGRSSSIACFLSK